jgi:hypothetical protein
MATDPRVETLNILRSIDNSLKALVAMQGGARQTERVDLDGPHGDPVVRAKDPRDWTGEPMKGRTFSQCPADYLDMIAERFEYFAGKETDEKKAKYCRLDAARARGWSQRIRGGFVPVPQPVSAGGFAGDEFGGDGAPWPESDFD